MLATDNAAALDGIEQRLQRTEEAHEALISDSLPTELSEAIERVSGSAWAKGVVGEDMFELYRQ